MRVGRLTITRFNGVEEFDIASAEIMAWLDSNSEVVINLEIACASPPVLTLPDTLPLRAKPGAEVSLVIREPAPVRFTGRQFVVPKSWDEGYGDNVSRFYYVEHEAMDDITVDVVKRIGNSFLVRWTGSTVDVNYYDGSKPPANLLIEAMFQFKEPDLWIVPG